MHDLLRAHNLYFQSRDEQPCKLKNLLDHAKQYDDYCLPLIVNISSSFNIQRRSIRTILTKNTPLLLLCTGSLESLLAECHRSNSGYQQQHPHRARLTQGKMATMASTKFRSMKKLSRSLASLNQTNPRGSVDDYDEDDLGNGTMYNQRTQNLLKKLNENQSSSVRLCRIPLDYRGLFELLNANDQSIEPCHTLADLLMLDDSDRRTTDQWPPAFLLRSTCTVFTKRHALDLPSDANKNNKKERKLSNSADSCYGSLSDLDSQKNIILLDDETQTLSSGEILTIGNMCYARRRQTIDHGSKEHLPPMPSPPTPSVHLSPTSWVRHKSRLLFPKKTRKSRTPDGHRSPLPPVDNIPNPFATISFLAQKPEPYLKCQTEQGNIVYISLHESGLFSPLRLKNPRTNGDNLADDDDISGVFHWKDLLAHFRLPLSVQLINGSSPFDNTLSTSTLQRQQSLPIPTKFRLHIPYTEHVVFACPLILPSKYQRSGSPIVIPIPVNADIYVQRCLNMREIVRSQLFQDLVRVCTHLADRYYTDLSLIHFPLELHSSINVLRDKDKRKQPLYKKRSQSETFIEFLPLGYTASPGRSCGRSLENLNNTTNTQQHPSDDSSSSYRSSSSPSSPRFASVRDNIRHDQLYYRDSFETIKQKLSNTSVNERDQPIRRSGHYARIKSEKTKKNNTGEELLQQKQALEDVSYSEIDQIYDYIRTGVVTDDMREILMEQQAAYSNGDADESYGTHSSSGRPHLTATSQVYIPPSANPAGKTSEQRLPPAANSSPGKMITHRFPPNLDDSRPCDNVYEFHSCHEDDQNDDDIAHARFLAEKQRASASHHATNKSKKTGFYRT